MNKQICHYIRTYSEIKNMQYAHKVAYFAESTEKGIVLSLVHIDKNGEFLERCLCPNLSIDGAKNMMLFLCENSVGRENWIYVLQDYGVEFLLIE